jgi:hypothetical protein
LLGRGGNISGSREEDIGDCSVTLLAASTVPHSPQKRLPAVVTAPHLGQRFSSGAPQSSQNFLAAGLSLQQFEQRIGTP